MPIDKIDQMTDCGIFRTFEWNDDFPDFREFNLLYGYNWSGKSTLSRIFRSLESGVYDDRGSFLITIGGTRISSESIQDPVPSIKVFNRDYIIDTVFPTDDAGMPAIAVGPTDVTAAQSIQRLRNELTVALTRHENTVQITQQNTRAFDQFATDQARVIRETLSTSGFREYINYNRTHYIDDIKSIPDNYAKPSEAELDRLRSIMSSQDNLSTLTPVFFNHDLRELFQYASDMFTEIPTGTFLDRVTGDPEVSEWVTHGFHIHERRSSTDCLYCDQPIPVSTRKELTEHFSSSTVDLRDRILKHIDSVRTVTNQLRSVRPSDGSLVHPVSRNEYITVTSEFAEKQITVTHSLEEVVRRLQAKLSDLTGSIYLTTQSSMRGGNLSARRRKSDSRADAAESFFRVEIFDFASLVNNRQR